MFSLTKERDQVYCLHFDKQEDLCLTFLRYQEYYESGNPEFQHHAFTINDFKKWYSNTHGEGQFTYPTDWTGFNIPLDTISKVQELGIPDPNFYDNFMSAVANYILNDAQTSNCYLIGVFGETKTALKHELAHALYFTNSKYKNKINEIFNNLPKGVRNTMVENLDNNGYAASSVIDEFQAYIVDDYINGIWPDPEKPQELMQASNDVINAYQEYNNVC